jgi:hypothetical protein
MGCGVPIVSLGATGVGELLLLFLKSSPTREYTAKLVFLALAVRVYAFRVRAFLLKELRSLMFVALAKGVMRLQMLLSHHLEPYS